MQLQWVKSSYSTGAHGVTAEGACVELAKMPGGGVMLRNSRDPEGPSLLFTDPEIWAFIRGARDGEFDRLVTPEHLIVDVAL